MQNFLLHINRIASAIHPQQSPKAPHERIRLNLVDFTGQTLRCLQPAASQVGITISTEKTVENISICGDAALITQALDGLVCQVIQLSKPGSQITLRLENLPDAQVMLSVRSSGLVLDAKYVDKLFEETANLPTTTNFGGLGIQLSLVKEIISRHNGKIWFDNPEDKEASFRIKIPIFK
ncbi:MAG: hypothetical protein IH586_03750, partial [Anaerolineaceae bacterium]|nr:hypothetical protein [Anaerolineaceae bacterium]